MIDIPPVVFGTSSLGNLFTAIPDDIKCAIVKECLRLSAGTVVFDTAGKYGAGLALEVLGKCLRNLDVEPDRVIISNKLGWLRTELTTPEPTFEPGVWKQLNYDAVQKISYDGILECFEQGNHLLDGYVPQMVSVHDPDEYLSAATDSDQERQRYDDILAAYEALFELKRQGKVNAVGIGAKNWKIIRRIAADVSLDWAMIANSLTIKNHPQELMAFILKLREDGVSIINAAVFHSGFLVGEDHFDYKQVRQDTAEGKALFKWRHDFFSLCSEYGVTPAAACIQFGMGVPGVSGIALSATDVRRVDENMALIKAQIPAGFWEAMKNEGLITLNVFNRQAALR